MASENPSPVKQQSSFFEGPSIPSVNTFTPTKLKWISNTHAANYRTWKEQMHCLMKSQELTPFINGDITPPLPSENAVNEWDRVDSLLKGWILSSLSEPIADAVVGLKTVTDILKELDRRFGEPEISSNSDTEGKRSMKDDTRLHRAALNGDWVTAMDIFLSNKEAITNRLGGRQEFTRPLHVAVGTGTNIDFVKQLVLLLPDDKSVAVTDFNESTALHIAAVVGNKAAASLLVDRLPDLCYVPNKSVCCPIHLAAQYAQREVLQFLIDHTHQPLKETTAPAWRKPLVNPYAESFGQKLLHYLIQSEFFDVALTLTKKYPEMLQIHGSLHDDPSTTPLELLTIKKQTLNTSHFTFFQRSIASYFHHRGDYQGLLWKLSKLLDPKIQEARNKMKADKQAQQLLEDMCKEIGEQEFNKAVEVFHRAILRAAKLDVRDVVVAIIKIFPGAIYSIERHSGQHIFQKAVDNRSVDVLNLIHQMSDHKQFFTSYLEDSYGNNSFHSAGKLAPPNKLNETRGAALQMQKEMQWFKEVEKVVHVYSRDHWNKSEKTPRIMFTKEHKVLKEEGERWMRDAATSYLIVAALIVTVAFAAAITVPGGNNSDNGFPIFSTELAFSIFAIFDAASLFFSTTSLLLCLSILTSRYTEEDFHQSLPKRLIFALSTLFLSVLFMVVAFTATMYLVLAQKRVWVLYPLLLLAVMPITPFLLFQTPLLYDLISATYGRGIFGKQRNGVIY